MVAVVVVRRGGVSLNDGADVVAAADVGKGGDAEAKVAVLWDLFSFGNLV